MSLTGGLGDALRRWEEGDVIAAADSLACHAEPCELVRCLAAIAFRLPGDVPKELEGEIHETLSNPERWGGADGVFRALRQGTRSQGGGRVAVLEHALKLAFNLSGGKPAYDDHQFTRALLRLATVPGLDAPAQQSVLGSAVREVSACS